MRIPLVVVLAALYTVAQQNDWLIVPGQRIGPITASTGRADLDRMFGKANIRDQNVDYGEGDIRPGTIVYPDKRSAMLTIFWASERIDNRLVQNRRRVGSIAICNALSYETPACMWRTQEGVSLGTSLEKLEALNERPFQIVAWRFGEGGGRIFSWEAGTLSGRIPDFLRLDLEPPSKREGWSSDQKRLEDSIKVVRQTVQGGRIDIMWSSDTSVRRLHPIVFFMELSFSGSK